MQLPIRQPTLLLAALVLVLAGLKALFDPALGNARDPDYYFQIARHVAEGRGLQTSVSLYYQGLKSLPHPSNVSPLWPLVLGAAGTLLDLPRAAALVPEALFLLDVVLLYLLVNAVLRLWGAGGGPSSAGGSAPYLGIAAAALLAANALFFRITSLPYTEGLAFALLFGALLATVRAVEGVAVGSRSLAWGAAAGALAGAAFLTRVQMAGVILAVPLGLAIAARADRRLLRPAGCALVAGLLPVAGWIAYLATWVRPFQPRVMLSLGTYRETPELAPLQFSVPTGSWAEYVADRLGGLAVAFSPTSPYSYLASFGWAALLVPLAAVQLALRPRELRPTLLRLASPAGSGVLTTLLAGLLLLLPVHLTHARFFLEWLFSFRHGLPFILLLSLALAYLHRCGHAWVRRFAWLLVAASLLTGSTAVGGLFGERFPPGPEPPERELVAWLDGQSPRPAVVTTLAQRLAVFSRSGFHWIECDQPPGQTLALLRHAGADYLIIYPQDEHCTFLEGIRQELETVREFGAPPIRACRLAAS